jgi:Predicted UDP-glucose 6-dehydrogenase
MNVLGHDAKKGFGGACFPKDTAALLKYAEDIGIELGVLKAVINKNNIIRGQYAELDDREKEQNVSFDDKI